MKDYMRKIILCMSVFSLLIISGCSNTEEPVEKEEAKTLVSNSVYDSPNNPTQEQIAVFNELSNALSSHAADELLAELVAVNFAYEFFSLYNKTGADDVGGLTFIPEASREDFKSYAAYKYYKNYATVISQYSKEDLPNVILHEVKAVTQGQFTYGNVPHNGYAVQLVLKYADSKLPQDSLKTNVTMQVIDDAGIYRVIASEDGASSGNTQNTNGQDTGNNQYGDQYFDSNTEGME